MAKIVKDRATLLSCIQLQTAMSDKSLTPEQLVATIQRYTKPDTEKDRVYRALPQVRQALLLVEEDVSQGQLGVLATCAEQIQSRGLDVDPHSLSSLKFTIRQVAERKGLEVATIQFRKVK
jgi:hypothetical protein